MSNERERPLESVPQFEEHFLEPKTYVSRWSVTKTFGHDLGISAAFRQWRAKSHCHFVHGYALAIELTFSGYSLDDRNWVIDFGSFSDLKKNILNFFDHKTIVAEDDPQLRFFQEGERLGVIDLVVLPRVGCEYFAQFIYEMTVSWLEKTQRPEIKLDYVKVSEHGSNSATYTRSYV